MLFDSPIDPSNFKECYLTMDLENKVRDKVLILNENIMSDWLKTLTDIELEYLKVMVSLVRSGIFYFDNSRNIDIAMLPISIIALENGSRGIEWDISVGKMEEYILKLEYVAVIEGFRRSGYITYKPISIFDAKFDVRLTEKGEEILGKFYGGLSFDKKSKDKIDLGKLGPELRNFFEKEVG